MLELREEIKEENVDVCAEEEVLDEIAWVSAVELEDEEVEVLAIAKFGIEVVAPAELRLVEFAEIVTNNPMPARRIAINAIIMKTILESANLP